MATEMPSSSWHPALMPDHENTSSSDPPVESAQKTSPDASPDSLHNGTPLEPEPEPHSLDFSANDGGDVDAWFANHDGDEGGAWLASEQSAPQEANPTDSPAMSAQVDEHHPPPPPTGTTSATGAQHGSSMSFARTVSHEISFADDDESDWNLSRTNTNTDPSKFMPPSDRTNSFPPVPPMTSSSDGQEHQPLPSNQALDVLEESEKDWDLHEHATDEDGQGPGQEPAPSPAAPPRRGHAPSQSMGGDFQAFETEASDTRYEEGVPLIGHSDEQAQEASHANQAKADPIPFAEDDGQEDDFFAQINDSQQPTQTENSTPPTLERKSTSQVIGDLQSEPPTRQNTFGALNEEDETTQVATEPTQTSQAPKRTGGHKRTKTEDLKAKWAEAFSGDDDDDFLLDDTEDKVDSTAFLGSDDEGLLDDTENPVPESQPIATTQPAPPQPTQPMSRQASGSSAYAPQNPYQPAPAAYQQSQFSGQPGAGSYFNPPAPTNAFNSAPQYGRPPLQGTDQPKAESFVDKSKGGYSSPFDLPTDIVGSIPKPRKRPSAQQLYAPGAQPAAQHPPTSRSTSMASSAPPPTNSRPPSSHESQGPPQGPPAISQKASAPTLRSKSSFFEELPMTARPRPGSRHSARAPSPAHAPPQGPPHAPPQGPPHGQSLGPSPLGPSMGHQAVAPPPAATHQAGPSPQPSADGNLVRPEKVSPYAALQSGAPPIPPPSGSASRYSPAPPPGNAALPPAAANRYSPVPPAPRQSNSYSPTRAAAATPPILPHQPRTSSPLAHFEIHSGKPHGDISLSERRSSSSSHEPRLNRVPSLPPTREVDEEDDQSEAGVTLNARHVSGESRYSPVPPPAQRTPPPPAAYTPHPGQSTLSPPKRTMSYAPQAPPASQPGFVPPPRAQTQSPGATRGSRPPMGHARRPSSAHSHATPEMTKSSQNAYAPGHRARGSSLTMNMVAPTDGREQDPLQRWKGVPILAWGVGGTVVTSFPKSIPRYTVASSTPTITRAPGEVKVKHIKEIDPLPERLAKFPGPLKGKSKKKEVVSWLTSGIDDLQKSLPDVSFHSELSLEAKRELERLLLWQILRIFVEHDGKLEGSSAVEKAVRDVLAPGSTAADTTDPASQSVPVTAMQSDAVDAGTMEQVRANLIKGDREAAVWTAVDKRLWGHAMLIAHTVSPDLYKQVAQEFVRKEVNYPGHSNESMAALYKILSGNFDDCVDELVPSHARAGFQLVSTDVTTGPPKATIDGLDKWRETLTLVLSNRSPEDVRGLNALGNLLASYGRAEAAHICYMFSRSASVFGGIDDPSANFVLLGSDHRQQAAQFAKETEALALSEVYEYGLSLAGGIAAAGGAPHLAAYKLQHAITLAENGYRDRALQYCDAIAVAMSSQTKRSPYYNNYLAASVDDFMIRLKQAPKGESGSWISKPSMNKVSDSMWNKFNKFVAGDDDESNANGGVGNANSSPFNQISSTPTISRSPSTNNFDVYGGGATGYPGGVVPPVPAMASKYAPATTPSGAASNPYEPTSQYAPARSSIDQGSSEYPGYPGVSQETSYPSAPSTRNNSYAAPSGYQPQGIPEPANMPALSPPQGQDTVNQGYSPPSFGYEPPQLNITPDPENKEDGAAGGYEPPSFQPYGFEPPSYQPDPEPSAEDGDNAPKKKKSFMDDDDDDIPALRPQEKSKADKDRENEEMFRKAAEEDAKRAAEEKANKKGWGFGSWFAKRAESPKPAESPNKPVRANLGEASSFVYDPDLKRWVNKKPGAENVEAKKATPPPPKAAPRSTAGTPPPPPGTPPPGRSASGPPRGMHTPGPVPDLAKAPSQESLGVPNAAPPMSRSASNNSAAGGGPPSAPPSRPTTSMSNASSIDDLLSASGPRKAGKKPRKSGRYVDVMAK